MTPSHFLFSYGTLQQSAVQLSLFGRVLESEPDELVGFTRSLIRIADSAFVDSNGAEQAMVTFTGNAQDRVGGVVLAVTTAELVKADSYEPVEYERVLVTTAAGRQAWVYAQRGSRL